MHTHTHTGPQTLNPFYILLSSDKAAQGSTERVACKMKHSGAVFLSLGWHRVERKTSRVPPTMAASMVEKCLQGSGV